MNANVQTIQLAPMSIEEMEMVVGGQVKDSVRDILIGKAIDSAVDLIRCTGCWVTGFVQGFCS